MENVRNEREDWDTNSPIDTHLLASCLTSLFCRLFLPSSPRIFLLSFQLRHGDGNSEILWRKGEQLLSFNPLLLVLLPPEESSCCRSVLSFSKSGK